jgi:hypothetical protein
VIDLADARDEVAVAPEHLRQRDGIGQDRPEIRLQFVDARRVGPQSGEERDAAGAAQRKLRVRAIEPHAAGGQAIEIRRLHQPIAERRHVVVEIVCHDEQNVRPGRLRLRDCRVRRAEQGGGQEPGRTRDTKPTNRKDTRLSWRVPS